jgi:hypothetical protein
MPITSGLFQPIPSGGFAVSRPHVMNKAGNLFRIDIHTPTQTDPNKKYQIWATKDAITSHFPGLEHPTPHHFEQFARTHYQKTLENPEHASKSGVFISTTQKVHGNPKLFSSMITDPEAKFV